MKKSNEITASLPTVAERKKQAMLERYKEGIIEIVSADKLMEKGFLQISRVLARRKDLTPATKLVWGAILGYAWGEKDSCFPGQEQLMEETGLGRTTIWRSLQQLQGDNDTGEVFLEVINRGHGISNIYRLFFKMTQDKQNYVKEKLIKKKLST